MLQELAEARRRGKADRAAAEALAVSVEAGVDGEGQRTAVDTPIKTWTVSIVFYCILLYSIVTFLVATAATACCTNDAELGTEFLARSSNMSMKKYTSKDVGLEGWGSTPVAFVDPGPDKANFGPSRSMNR